MADVCVKATLTLLPLCSTIRQDSWLDYWWSQCLLHCSLTEPLPLHHPVASRLLLKPVCSSPCCQIFPVLDVPLLLPPSFFFHLPSLSQHYPLSTSSILVDLWKLKTVKGVGRRKHREVEDLSLSANLSHYFHCSATVTAACILMKRRPLWLLLHSARADIFLSCLPLKCPFCVSYW